MHSKNQQIKSLSNIWVTLGAIIVASILSLILWSLLISTRPEGQIRGPSTAVLNILEIPTATFTPLVRTSMPTVSQSTEIPPTPLPGEISVGDLLQISGTGGDGLRLRASPGLQGEVLFLGYEGEVFQALEGPEEADGYIWWYLAAPYDEKVKGWAVSNYLTILQNP